MMDIAIGSKKLWIIVGAVVLLIVGASLYGLTRSTDDTAGDKQTAKSGTSDTATPESDAPSAKAAKPKPTATRTQQEALDGGLFNVEGTEKTTLPADKGETTIKGGKLGLACGGKYPTILFKTVSRSAKTSLCGDSPAGGDFRMVTRQDGTVYDMAADYQFGTDTFVAKRNGVSYILEGYSGDLIVKKDGSSTRQTATDWMSLDNEADYD